MRKIFKSSSSPRWLLLSLCLCVSAANLSCSTKPTDLRTLAPAETLVYLETNDLAAALQPIVDSKPFTEVAKTKPDFSALKGVQLAVAVTGFETSEIALTDEHSVGKVQPRFVAIADTHAWNFQAVKFAELKLGSFVADIYGSEPKLEQSDKYGGRYFTWTADDGRKAFALVIDAIIYFGNDESTIERCLAVRRGESDSILTTGKIQSTAPGTLASGYVSTDGIAQIANIAGMKFATELGEDPDVQSAVAGILPQLLRNSVTDITWTANTSESGIEDKYLISMPQEISSVFAETMITPPRTDGFQTGVNRMIGEVPADLGTATRYNFKDPQLAWRSAVLIAGGKIDPVNRILVTAFADALFEPYGIRSPEIFLSSLGDRNERSSNIISVRLDPDIDESVVISMSGDYPKTQESFAKDLKRVSQGEDGWSIWEADGGEIRVSFEAGLVKIGSSEELGKLQRGTGKPSEFTGMLASSNAPVATIGRDRVSLSPLAELFLPEANGETKSVANFFTETRFTKIGMERRTVSDLGFIGWMIAQLAQN